MKANITLLLIPQIAVLILPFESWLLMMLYVGMMFVCLKAATWQTAGSKKTINGMCYAALWVGMNPIEFEGKNTGHSPLISGTLSLTVGIIMSLVTLQQNNEVIRATMLFITMFFIFHFGLLELNARIWQKLGKNVKPIMDAPWKAKTLSEFWGKRWNMAFRDAAHLIIFNPLRKKVGTKVAIFAVFLFSGIVHEAVISVPAGGGYGGPMIYFLLQFIGLILQKKWRFLNHPIFTWVFLLLPLPMLFHGPFLLNVFLPLSNKIGG
jgi:hypothetical protein